MSRLAEILRSEGQPFTVNGSHPFVLAGNDMVWWVEEGEMAVFSVEKSGGEVSGRRAYRAGIFTGQIMFGFEYENQPHVLLAMAVGECRLRQLSRRRFWELAGDEFVRREMASLVEFWVERLTAAAALARVSPAHAEKMEAGRTVRLQAGICAYAPDNAVWVEQLSGEGRFLGWQGIQPWTAGARFLLGHQGWLQADAAADFRVLSVAEGIACDPEGSALENFHRAILGALEIRIGEERSIEWRQLEDRLHQNNVASEEAEARLASVMNRRALRLAMLGRGQNVFYSVCRVVGDAMGIDIRHPPDPLDGRPSQDPLGDIARASRIRFRKVMLRDDWHQQDGGPIVGFREEGHVPVAILPVSPRSYEMYDPSTQSCVPVSGRALASLSGEGYMFYRPFAEKIVKAGEVLRFGLRGCGKDIRTALWMGIFSGLLGLLMPFVTGKVFDDVIPNAEYGQLGEYAIGLVAVAIGATFFQLTRGFAMLRVEGKMDNTVQCAVWDRLLELPAPFFRNYSVGDLSMRASGINNIRQILSGTVVSSILSSIFSVFNLLLMLWYSWKLTLLALVLTFVAMLAAFVAAALQVYYQRRVMELQGQVAGFVLQLIMGIAKLRVAGAEIRGFNVWARKFAEQRTFTYRARVASNWFSVFDSFFPLLCSAAIYLVIAFFLKGSSEMSTGHFISFTTAFGVFLGAALGLSNILISILKVVPLYERAKPILQTLPETDANKSDPGPLFGGLEVSHVTFSYAKGGPEVLKNLTFSVKPGQCVALVGPSGAGKSTLLRLFLGFELPDAGAIYFDGQNLSNLDLRLLRRQLGVVLQNARIISGDIFTNIVGASHLTEDDAWEAARMAGLDDDIRQMPMGMRTFISEGAATFSGGQRQRLMIARALVSKPRLVFFDEATSSLDNRTQAVVRDSLQRLRVTRIIIAHRLSTIVKADQIHVMQEGRIVESGNYDELMARRGVFHELAQRQLE
ncbi:MAG: NHLP bacteriocin export ABC transporter permease/ATPase subunit [Verrucomicrobiae bacterium]|nr:NHLP bacteriocin export ABC transporter permease/ATPase subunit [Verrucomicrobiae bacterium]